MEAPVVPLGLVLLVLLAGCAGGPGSADPAPTLTPPTPTNRTADGDVSLGSNRFANLSVGGPSALPEGVEPHRYLIGNDRSDPRDVRIVVWRDARVVLNRSVEFPGHGVLEIEVFRPGEYTLVIDPANASRHVIDAPDEWDCNYRRVVAGVEPDGRLSFFTLRSLVKCG